MLAGPTILPRLKPDHVRKFDGEKGFSGLPGYIGLDPSNPRFIRVFSLKYESDRTLNYPTCGGSGAPPLKKALALCQSTGLVHSEHVQFGQSEARTYDPNPSKKNSGSFKKYLEKTTRGIDEGKKQPAIVLCIKKISSEILRGFGGKELRRLGRFDGFDGIEECGR